jgi:hypothetical protein
MMGFELRPHDRQVASHPTDPSIADRFLEVIVRLHLENSLEPDVLEAAGEMSCACSGQRKRTELPPIQKSTCH